MRYRTAIETYIYRHGQAVGYQVRRVKKKDGRTLYDVSKYFGIREHGTLASAARAARNWKNRHLRARSW